MAQAGLAGQLQGDGPALGAGRQLGGQVVIEGQVQGGLDQGGGLVGRKAEIGLGQLQHPALGPQPGDGRQRRLPPGGQDEAQGRGRVAEQAVQGGHDLRAVGDQVDVVQDEGQGPGLLVQAVQQPGKGVGGLALGQGQQLPRLGGGLRAGGGEGLGQAAQKGGQVGFVLFQGTPGEGRAALPAGHPLGQEGGLAVPGGGDEQRQAETRPFIQAGQEAGAGDGSPRQGRRGQFGRQNRPGPGAHPTRLRC